MNENTSATPAPVPAGTPATRQGISAALIFRRGLVLASFAFGVTLAWAMAEHQMRSRASTELAMLRTDRALIRATHAQVGRSVALRDTSFIRMAGRGELAGTSVVLAWNAGRRHGVLFLPELPPPASGKQYVLWTMDSEGVKAPGVPVTAPLAGGIVELDLPEASTEASRFIITAEAGNGSAAPTAPPLFESEE